MLLKLSSLDCMEIKNAQIFLPENLFGNKCASLLYIVLNHLDNDQMRRKVDTPCQCASTNQNLNWDVMHRIK